MQELFSTGFADILLRFAICILVNWGIVHFLYFKKSQRRDFYFTFVIISVAIFFLVYLMMGMDRGKATMGVGLGLFGIFSIMRYRTDSMPVREMTYLFVVVCLSVVHAMADMVGVDADGKMIGTPIAELVVIDIIVIAAIIVFESFLKVEVWIRWFQEESGSRQEEKILPELLTKKVRRFMSWGLLKKRPRPMPSLIS